MWSIHFHLSHILVSAQIDLGELFLLNYYPTGYG